MRYAIIALNITFGSSPPVNRDKSGRASHRVSEANGRCCGIGSCSYCRFNDNLLRNRYVCKWLENYVHFTFVQWHSMQSQPLLWCQFQFQFDATIKIFAVCPFLRLIWFTLAYFVLIACRQFMRRTIQFGNRRVFSVYHSLLRKQIESTAMNLWIRRRCVHTRHTDNDRASTIFYHPFYSSSISDFKKREKNGATKSGQLMAVWFIISMWQSFIDRLIIRVAGHNVSFNHEIIILCCSNIIMHRQSNDIYIKFPLNILTTHFLCALPLKKKQQQRQRLQQQQQWQSTLNSLASKTCLCFCTVFSLASIAVAAAAVAISARLFLIEIFSISKRCDRISG